jgi:hypothetical protein
VPGSPAPSQTLDRVAVTRPAGWLDRVARIRLSERADCQQADLLVLLVFLAVSAVLFRLSLFEGWTFVGDSDRLNTVLSVRLFETDALRTRGSIPTWTEQQFMGYSMAGLHWILPAFTPLPYLLVLLPTSQMFGALAVFATLLLALAMAAAYVALRPYSHGPIPAAAGGLVYGLSSYTVLRIAQLDLPFCLLILMPLMLVLIRRTGRGTAASSFLWLTACWAALVLLTFLQEVAYVTALVGAYALYRAARLRDPWPLLVLGLAFGVGVVIGLPRVITVGLDFRELARSENNYQTSSIEALRFFGDGLLGRFIGEQQRVLGGPLNLHEGVQLLGSALAALLALLFGLLSRSRLMRVLAVTMVVILSVVLSAYWRPFYDVQLGLARITFVSRELRAVLVNVVLVGLPLWIVTWWIARRAGQTSTSPDESAPNAPTPAAALDAPFCLGIVVLVLAVILIPEARTLLYNAFFRVDFTHSRICVAALVPLAALTTMFLDRFLPARLPPKALNWLLAGAGLGLLLWLGREALGDLLVDRLGPALNTRPWRVVTIETVRAVSSLLLALVAAAILLRRPRPALLALVGGLLVCWLALESIASADFKLSGPQTTEQVIPFDANSHLYAPPGALRPPSPAERAVLRDRLETDQYRTLLYQDRKEFPALVEPHIAAFWNLRLLEGYSTGLPRRLGLLPWVDSMVAPHALDIHAIHPLDRLPWRLLAALNVKYAVVVDRSLWFNPAPGGRDPPLDVAQLKVLENPYPVTPRAFFAALVSPAVDPARFPGDAGRRPPPTDPPVEDPATHSVAEGIAREQRFSTAGALNATFDGDRITVKVDASSEPRFLVLNELYHPSWRAWIDGQPAEIYPTNVVMRGIVVPPGATTIELRFVPFIVSWYGLGVFAVGFIAAGLGWWGLRRATR